MNRDALLSIALVAFSAVGNGCSNPGTGEAAISLTSDSQLFVDNFLIESSDGVVKTLNRPGKHPANPLIRADRPWEGYLVLQPGSVIFDEEEGLFKMWYNSLPSTKRPDVEDFLCYATSKDGVHWEKPDLGLVAYRGSTANNIFLKDSAWTHSVIKDPDDKDPNRRYKLAYWRTHDRSECGVWVAFSSDGVRWTNHPDNPVVPCSATGDTFSVMQDAASKQYWLYHKSKIRPIRKVARLVSDDFVHWRDSQLVLQPDENDQPDTEFYGLSAFSYGGQYLGLLWVFHTYSQLMDTQLVSSRDGLVWDRSGYRRIFLPLGYMRNEYGGSSFDSGMVFPATAPAVKDDKLWIYYSGFSNLHNALAEEHTGEIGLATLRLDGFVSLEATSEASVVTRPVTFQGSSMALNARTRAMEQQGGAFNPAWKELFTDVPDGKGSIRVEVQDADGQPISGYRAEECIPVQGDGVRLGISWDGDKDLSELEGRAVRFKFVMSNASLYSFRIR